jgi:hypothetical protein
VGAAASKHADSGTDGRDHDLEGSRVPIFPNCVLCISKDVLFLAQRLILEHEVTRDI